jgi:hypothetical protein
MLDRMGGISAVGGRSRQPGPRIETGPFYPFAMDSEIAAPYRVRLRQWSLFCLGVVGVVSLGTLVLEVGIRRSAPTYPTPFDAAVVIAMAVMDAWLIVRGALGGVAVTGVVVENRSLLTTTRTPLDAIDAVVVKPSRNGGEPRTYLRIGQQSLLLRGLSFRHRHSPPKNWDRCGGCRAMMKAATGLADRLQVPLEAGDFLPRSR